MSYKDEYAEVKCSGCGIPIECNCGDKEHYCGSCMSRMSRKEIDALMKRLSPPNGKSPISHLAGGDPRFPGKLPKRRKIGMNEKCPCGSGKKFKKCCLGKGIYDR